MVDRSQLLERVDLVALADEFLGPHHGTRTSPSWACPNPRHPQTGRTPPVAVFVARSGEQRWYCHGCGLGGTAIALVMAVGAVSIRAAIDELAARVGLADNAPSRLPPPIRTAPWRA